MRLFRFWSGLLACLGLAGLLVVCFSTLVLELTPTAQFPVYVQPTDPLITALHNRQRHDDVIAIEVRRLAKLYAKDGVTPHLLLAVIEVESGFNKNARGKSGEIGLMQIKPSTARAILCDMSLEPDAIYSPAVNLSVGTCYLVRLHRVLVAGGHEKLTDFQATILAYNAGLAHVLTLLREGAPMTGHHYTKVRRAMARWHHVLEGTT